MEPRFLTYDQLALGDRASLTRELSPELVRRYGELMGDTNPVHYDAQLAARSFFRRPIAHGMLVAGLISTVLGTRLPGPGAIFLSHDIEYKMPVGLNDVITAHVEVVEKEDKTQKVKLRAWVEKQTGLVVVDGQALVLVKGFRPA